MTALDGQEVISALSRAIREAFTTSEFVKLYKDTPVQNMQKPCVFLHSVNTTHEPRMRNRARWHYIIDIRCHPADKITNFQSWASGIAVRMLDIVSQLQFENSKIRATNAEWHTEGGVLHVTVKYSLSVYQTQRETP